VTLGTSAVNTTAAAATAALNCLNIFLFLPHV
jgi:hypothetical protein